MNHNGFKLYYTTPTKLIKSVLIMLEQILYHPTCLPHCLNSCHIHHPPRILLPQYTQYIYPIYPIPPIHPFLPPHPSHPIPPRYITQNLIRYFISHILDHITPIQKSPLHSLLFLQRPMAFNGSNSRQKPYKTSPNIRLQIQ
jgi:hypothetical protein